MENIKSLNAKAEKLLAKNDLHDTYKARKLILNAAYGPKQNLNVRKLYEKLLPLAKKQKEFIDNYLVNLSSTSAEKRKKAAKELSKAAGSPNVPSADLVIDPRCLDYIIPALSSEDNKVALAAVYTLDRVAFWGFYDWRAWKPLQKLLKHKDKNIRRWAVQALGHLGFEKAIDLILPLYEDKAEWVRDEVGRILFYLNMEKKLSVSSKKKLLNFAREYEKSGDTTKRNIGIGLLKLLDQKNIIIPIKNYFKK